MADAILIGSGSHGGARIGQGAMQIGFMKWHCRADRGVEPRPGMYTRRDYQVLN